MRRPNTDESKHIGYRRHFSFWIQHYHPFSVYPLVCHAIKHNLHGAVAFSVVSGKEILGIFEFFSLQKQPVDAYLLDCLNTLGNHIGQF
mgnify:FL=1